MSLCFKVTTIKTVKQMDELVDSGTDTPVWQRYRLKIMSLSQQVSSAPEQRERPLVYGDFLRPKSQRKEKERADECSCGPQR